MKRIFRRNLLAARWLQDSFRSFHRPGCRGAGLPGLGEAPIPSSPFRRERTAGRLLSSPTLMTHRAEDAMTLSHRLLVLLAALVLGLAASRADEPKEEPKAKLTAEEQTILDLT